MRSCTVTHATHRMRYLGAALGLLGLINPTRLARAGDDPAPAVVAVTRPATGADDAIYLEESTMAAVVIRPAAALRRLGSDQVGPLVRLVIGDSTGRLAAWFQDDPPQPGCRRPEAADIEAITVGVWMKQTRRNSGDPARPVGDGFTAGTTGCVVRAVAATDWLAVLRRWGVEVKEIRGCHAPYYRLYLPPAAGYKLPVLFASLPDDRTLIVHETEEDVRSIVAGSAPEAPPFLQGADWRGANQGLAAVALDNRDGQILKLLSGMFEGDGLAVGTVFLGVERWVATLADADEIEVSAEATARSSLAAGMLGWGLGKLVDLARTEFKTGPPVDPAVAKAAVEGNEVDADFVKQAAELDRLVASMDEKQTDALTRLKVEDAIARLKVQLARLDRLKAKVEGMPSEALARLRVEVNGPLVRVGSAGFGTYAEIGRILWILYADEHEIENLEPILRDTPER